MWYVYLLLCEDGSFYTGVSNNLEKRFEEHRLGRGAKYTRSHKPVKLVHQEQFSTHSEALKREIKIKSWSRSKKIKILGLMED